MISRPRTSIRMSPAPVAFEFKFKFGSHGRWQIRVEGHRRVVRRVPPPSLWDPSPTPGPHLLTHANCKPQCQSPSNIQARPVFSRGPISNHRPRRPAAARPNPTMVRGARMRSSVGAKAPVGLWSSSQSLCVHPTHCTGHAGTDAGRPAAVRAAVGIPDLATYRLALLAAGSVCLVLSVGLLAYLFLARGGARDKATSRLHSRRGGRCWRTRS